jgi:hypothetical protein
VNVSKKRLNIDDHQFHKYQQNKQSTLILTALAEHKMTTIYDARNSDPVVGEYFTSFIEIQIIQKMVSNGLLFLYCPYVTSNRKAVLL